jgi:hypothetical protein
MERGALNGAQNLDQLFGFLDYWRRANAERKRHQALLGGDRLRPGNQDSNKRLVG